MAFSAKATSLLLQIKFVKDTKTWLKVIYDLTFQALFTFIYVCTGVKGFIKGFFHLKSIFLLCDHNRAHRRNDKAIHGEG